MLRTNRYAKQIGYIICISLAAAIALLVMLNVCWPSPKQRFASVHPASTVPPLYGISADSLINTGDAKALDNLPGVGEVIAQRIIETRESLGGFRLPEELMLVKGIGEKTLEKIMDALNEPLVLLQKMTD